MNKLNPAALCGAALLATLPAAAGEMKGPVAAVNLQTRTIQIAEPSCGCTTVAFVFPPDVNMAGVTEGTTVTVTFTSAGTVNTVTKVTR